LALGLLFVRCPLRLPKATANSSSEKTLLKAILGSVIFFKKKRIYRERMKSIKENNRGIFVMDRGNFAARMLGFVFIPATMPEYQEIRSELAQWAPVKVKS
jgi:hypothetical protein